MARFGCKAALADAHCWPSARRAHTPRATCALAPPRDALSRVRALLGSPVPGAGPACLAIGRAPSGRRRSPKPLVRIDTRRGLSFLPPTGWSCATRCVAFISASACARRRSSAADSEAPSTEAAAVEAARKAASFFSACESGSAFEWCRTLASFTPPYSLRKRRRA
jgi:hypothetical protein